MINFNSVPRDPIICYTSALAYSRSSGFVTILCIVALLIHATKALESRTVHVTLHRDKRWSLYYVI